MTESFRTLNPVSERLCRDRLVEHMLEACAFSYISPHSETTTGNFGLLLAPTDIFST